MTRKSARSAKLTRNFLHEEYVVKQRSAKDIAAELGYDYPTQVHVAIHKFGLPKHNNLEVAASLTKDVLFDLYINKRKSAGQIAEDLGIKSSTTILDALRRHGIIVRDHSEREYQKGSRHKKWCGYELLSGSYWTNIRWAAASRNLIFDLTIEYAWSIYIGQNKRCALSGVPISFPPDGAAKNRSLQTASLDRIDSNIGYIQGNVQWIHKEIQDMKWDKSEPDFVRWCVAIASYRGNGDV